MENPATNNDTPPAPAKRRMRSGHRSLWIGGIALAAAIVVPSALFFRRPLRPPSPLRPLRSLSSSLRKEAAAESSVTVRKMDLVIRSVFEGGTLVSPGSREITCKVEGQATILSVVPEGSVITPEEVEDERVLMELDSSALRQKANQQQAAVESAAAALAQARDSYEIQKNLDDNQIKGAELKAKFALMDVEKYLGTTLTPRVLEGAITPASFHELATESELPAEAPKPPEPNGSPKPAWAKLQEAIQQAIKVVNGQEQIVSFHWPKARPKGIPLKLETLQLGGTARQDWRRFQTAIEMADEDLSRAATTYQWSKRLGPKELGGKGYIPGTEVEADRAALERCELQLEQTKLDLDIFLRYDLPKQTELLLSAYQQACEELELEQAKVRAELDKAEAQVRLAEAAYRQEKTRLDHLNDQIAACLIYATRPGVVAYAHTRPAGADTDAIREGAAVHEGQPLMTLLGEGRLAVKVKVQKASANQIRRGQKARIVLDGFPNREYSGQVQKVLAVADTLSPGRIPDPKEFNVIVVMDNPPADLKPGMSAKVEILIANLTGVLAAPTQAVAAVDGRRICYVAGKRGAEPRVVQTGPSNDNFIEITGGLEPGEKVLLHPPLPASAATASSATTAQVEAKLPKPASPEAQDPKPAAPSRSAMP
jgi:RND family efflux transporter MFP subunit